MKFVDLFDWENRPLCRRIGIFIYACLTIGTYAFLFSLLGSQNVYRLLFTIKEIFGLCSVKGITIERQDDNQIKKITIDFKQVNVGE